MLSEVVGNKMISMVMSFSGGAAPSLSETNNTRIEASPVPIKSIARRDTATDMPPPRGNLNPATNTAASTGSKLKVQDLNEFFICFLCGGYKIEATTINECMHSFCRSCIVKHLEVKHYCPECFHKKFVVNADGNGNMLRIGIVNSSNGQQNTVQTPRIITSQNLNLDRTLSALIYKSVPGLYQREMASVQKFYAKKSDDLKPIGVDSHQCSSFERILFRDAKAAESKDTAEDPVYVSADEPISLSLEYHPKELQGLMNVGPENIPKVQYLQCPAGVCIRHLEKFLCSKFSISPQEYNVDVIYEDKVLHKSFKLMDVVYCFNWKRDAPMRFFYRIFLTGQAESQPRMRTKMVVKDNDDMKKPEPAPTKHKSESSTALPPITMRIKHDLHTNGTENEKRHENKIKLSNIIGSSKEQGDSNSKSSPRRGDGGSSNRQQISAVPVAEKRSSSESTHGNVDGPRPGEKRKMKNEFEFVDEVTISRSPKGAKSPSSSSMRSPQRQHSPKTVTFNDTVQATRIPFIKYVNPATSNVTSPPNDFKRLRSNDMVNSSSNSSSSLPKVTGNNAVSSTSSSSTSTVTTTSAAAASSMKNTSSTATNDSSRITSGTVPDNNSKQFPSRQQQQQQHQPQQLSTQLHTSSSSTVAAAAAQQISKHTKSNAQQLHNNNMSEKFPTSSSSLSAKNETAIGNNRHQNSGSSSSSSKKRSDSADDPWNNRQQQTLGGGDPKNDFNGNLKHEKNHNVAMLANNETSKKTTEDRSELDRGRERDADKYEYVKNIGLKPIHEVVRGMDVKNKDVDAAKRKTSTSDSIDDDPTSMLHHKKKKKSKHSKDFPFADMKKKKVDYDLAISSSNVPKVISSSAVKDSHDNSRSQTHHPDSLKMKFVKVTNDKSNAKVVVVPKPAEKEPTNGRTVSSSSSSSNNNTSKSPSPPKGAPVPPLATASMQISGNQTPRPNHSNRVPNLGNFVIKDSSMEIHQIPKGVRNSPAYPPKKSPSPPSLTITSSPAVNRNQLQPVTNKSSNGNAQPAKRTQSMNAPGPAPVAKKPHVQNQRSLDGSSYKDPSGVSPFAQRSYSYDPSVVMGNNYNLPLTPFQLQLATEMMFQKQMQQQYAAVAAATAKQATVGGPMPSQMMSFFNAPQSRSPPVNPATNSVSKKPVPPLVPPSSLTNSPFGKYNPVPNLVATSAAKPQINNNSSRLQEKPPMVEIVRLPPGLDKVEIPHIPAKVPTKANRPPPPTIPLVKIRRASANSTSSTESGDGLLDLSGKQPSTTTTSKGPGEKVGTGSQKPLPQLNEISKISRGNALIHRQQSASVRSVPNPSALALRNQMPQSAKGPSSSPAAAREEYLQRSGMSPARLSPPAMASFSSKSSNLEKLASKIKEGVATTNNSMAK